MFGGSYTHNLDSAGRFVMPMSIRLNLGEKFFITRGIGCLLVFSEEWAHELENQLDNLGSPLALLLNPDISRLHRHFFSGMIETGTDKQFRVQLPTEHRIFAGITDEVVICGCGKYIELWAPDALKKYREANDGVDDLIRAGEMLLPPPGGKVAGECDEGVSQTGPG